MTNNSKRENKLEVLLDNSCSLCYLNIFAQLYAKKDPVSRSASFIYRYL
jgi:hypothetical protein